MASKNSPRGLGRGLDAILSGNDLPATANDRSDAVRSIPIRLIDVNHDQPRKTFDDDSLSELAESIRSVGILQPVIASEKNGRYTIIAGERRFRAARIAGLDAIPVIVRDYDEQKRMEAALIENLQRSDLNPVEAAFGIRSLMENSSLTQEETAARLGMSRSNLTNTLRLLSLCEPVLDMLREGKLSAGHGRCLVGLEPVRQVQLANLVCAQHWSVRQLEKVCTAPAPEKKPPRPPRDVQLTRLETMARSVFGTRVRLDGTQESGKLTISYYNRDDLERIWDILDALGKEN